MRRVLAGLLVLILAVAAVVLWRRPSAAAGLPGAGSAAAIAGASDAHAAAATPATAAERRSGGSAQTLAADDVAGTDQPPAMPLRGSAPLAEMAFLRGRAINGEMAGRVIGSRDFDLILQKLATQAESSGLAKARAYKNNFRDYLGETDPGFAVRDVACGAHVCMASASSTRPSDAQFSTAVQAMAGSVDAPMYSTVMQSLPNPDVPGAYLHRIIFTTDPSLAAISVSVP